VDDILKRLSGVETAVADVRTQVGAIWATIPHLATAVSVGEVKSQVNAILTVIPHLATKADLSEIRADLSSMEAALIKWIVATGLASVGLAFTVAKLVH